MSNLFSDPLIKPKDDIAGVFDEENGLLDRRIFSDDDLYQQELDQIFGRAWNFMVHESMLPNVGDYFINYIGEDQVIVVRDKTEKIQVLLNTCRHRGNALCRAEQGNAKSFVCSYHGWNYDLQGNLVGIPGRKDYYRDDIDQANLGLAKAAKVDSFEGFYFATLDPEAPSLYDYLGEVGRTGIYMMTANGEIEAVNGVQKNIVDCNWKIAVDNLFDWYHVRYSHHSAVKAGLLDIDKMLHPLNQMVLLGEYGHAISGPCIPEKLQQQIDTMTDEQRKEFSEADGSVRLRPASAKKKMGEQGVRSMGHPNIFPNLWVTLNGMQFCLRLPRGAHSTELWWFTLVQKDATPEQRKVVVRFANHTFGPAGLLEQDDGENWTQSSQTSKGRASGLLKHHLAMAQGHDIIATDKNGAGVIETHINEHAQRWNYQAWQDWMQAKDWADLKQNHRKVPEGKI